MQVVLQVLQEMSPKAIPQVRVCAIPRVGDKGVARPGLVQHKEGARDRVEDTKLSNERRKSKRRAQ